MDKEKTKKQKEHNCKNQEKKCCENKEKQQNKTQNTESDEMIPKQEYNNIKDMLQRTHAEFQNYQRRTEEEKSKFIKLSNEGLIKKIIPVLDNFELALKHTKEKTEFTEGMQLIYTQLLQVLEDEGVQKINTLGKFNPNIHEALLTDESDKEEGQILQELQKGYTLNGKIIRTAKVKISKKQNKTEEQKNE
ncbi:MAG: nucleotide exchange factor GrpE [Candidatus Woesearchaeota archaeon]